MVGFGLGRTVHAVPSQVSTNVFGDRSSDSYEPTALHDVGAAHETAESTFEGRLKVDGLGLGTIVHARPSQCSTTVSMVPLFPSWSPTTTTHDFGVAHETAVRRGF